MRLWGRVNNVKRPHSIFQVRLAGIASAGGLGGASASAPPSREFAPHQKFEPATQLVQRFQRQMGGNCIAPRAQHPRAPQTPRRGPTRHAALRRPAFVNCLLGDECQRGLDRMGARTAGAHFRGEQ